jgi:hypothetical protein
MLILVAALTLATGAPAAEAAPTPAPAAASEALKPGERRVKVVCKEITKSNSRFSKKQCYELEAYKRQQEIDRQAFEETQNRPVISTARGN